MLIKKVLFLHENLVEENISECGDFVGDVASFARVVKELGSIDTVCSSACDKSDFFDSGDGHCYNQTVQVSLSRFSVEQNQVRIVATFLEDSYTMMHSWLISG